MSAYALPGSFLSSLSTTSSKTTSPTTASPIVHGTNKNNNVARSTLITTNDTKQQQQQQYSVSNSNANSNRDRDSNNTSNTTDFLISIKSASIDHIRLIQSFTNTLTSSLPSLPSPSMLSTSTQSSYSYDNDADADADEEQWGEYGDSDDDDENDTKTSLLSYSLSQSSIQSDEKKSCSFDERDYSTSTTPTTPSSPSFPSQPQYKSKSNNNNNNNSSSVSSNTNQNNAQNDAIQFKLAIAFNGRQYTATRSLPSFMKLRNDLMQELSKRNSTMNSRYNHKYNSSNASTSTNTSHNLHKQYHPSSIRKNDEEDSDEDDYDEFIIPELPQNVAYAMMGFAASGFSGLQAAVASYCPPMENWLRNVADLAPSSTSLANFLWEPLQGSRNTSGSGCGTSSSTSSSSSRPKRNKHSLRRSSSLVMKSSMTLDSINEDSGDDADEES
jgi:hypothetical protein